jgi:hypothetical protein
MRTVNSRNGNNRTPARSRASSDFRGRSVEATSEKSGLTVRLSVVASAKLRVELRRLARSNSPKTIEFANRMWDRYPELRA